jgi:predicted ATPase/DNA-binding winged helix-turn-helix (wHTH) protein
LSSPPQRKSAVSFGPFNLHIGERYLERDGVPVQIGGRALDILIALIDRAGDVVSKSDLMAFVWPQTIVDESGLRVHMAALRKALADGQKNARYITNIPGRGYCFVTPVSRLTPVEAPSVQTQTIDLPPKSRLPPILTRMIGRDAAVRTLADQLLAHRFVTIVAAGGMGKTSVAVAVGHELSSNFASAVIFIDFGSIPNPQLASNLLSSTLGLAIQAADPTPSMIAWLSEQKILLILDNCEHVIDAVAPLAEQIFGAAPNVHILATSREALRAEGEYVHRLEPLECPQGLEDLTAAKATTFPAVQLFVERAAANGTALELNDVDARIVGEICNRLDGLALAIELAASRVHAHGLHGMATLLENRFRLQWQGRRTALPRHQTLNSLLDWSYRLLPEAGQQMLRRLAIFVGTFSLDAAVAVGADENDDHAQIAEAVASLVEKSLVSVIGSERDYRYRLLETTRAYVLSKLSASGEGGAIAARHTIYYTGRLETLGKVDRTLPPSNWDTNALDHLGNVRAALEWVFSDQGDIGLGVELAAAATPHLLELSLLGECLHWSERAIGALRQEHRGTAMEMVLQETLAISLMFTKGNGEDVRGAIVRGLELAEGVDDSRHRLTMLAGLNIFLTRTGDFVEALTVGGRCLTLARRLGDPAAMIMAEWMLGVGYHLVGDQRAAHNHCDAGFALAAMHPQANTDYFGYDHRVRALVALTRSLWLLGLADQAVEVADQAVEEAARRSQPVTTCISLIYSAPVYLWCGDTAKAGAVADQLIDHAKRHSLLPYQAVGMGLKGQCLVRNGEAARGLEFLEQALKVMSNEHHNVQATTFLTGKAEALLNLGRPGAALTAVEDAIALGGPNGDVFDMPEILRVQAAILTSTTPPNLTGAENALWRSIEKARRQSALSLELRATAALTKLISAKGRPDEAHNLLASVYDRFEEGLSTADLVDARLELERLSKLER